MWKNTYKKQYPEEQMYLSQNLQTKYTVTNRFQWKFYLKKKNSTHECTKYKFILINNVILA